MGFERQSLADSDRGTFFLSSSSFIMCCAFDFKEQISSALIQRKHPLPQLHFRKLIKQTLPASEPIINGLQPAYSPEDMIEANCTCPKSKPKATMAWYLNGIKVERYFLVFYATSEDEEGLSESVLGLNRRAEVTLFPGGGPLELRCTATVQERTWAKTATALLARLNNQKLAQDDFTNKSDEVCVSLLLLLSSMLLNFCW